MRLVQKLSPMQPALARIPMNRDASEKALTCTTCHKAHRFDTREAAVEACLSCHNDTHSRTYKGSPHFRLWQAERANRAPAGTGVSCATCHLPREVHKQEDLDAVQVQHNQNDNLRPNEKMIRGVCMHCHELGFSIDALAEFKLINNNFTGQPARHMKSLDWAEQALKLETDKKPGGKLKANTCDPRGPPGPIRQSVQFVKEKLNTSTMSSLTKVRRTMAKVRRSMNKARRSLTM